jgi:hypothetical protein
MDAVYRGEVPPESNIPVSGSVKMKKPGERETTDEMVKKLQNLEGLL